MKIGVPKENKQGENRVAITPDAVKSFVKAGFEVVVETGAGLNSFFPDEQFTSAGASLADKKTVYAADIVCKVNAPAPDDIALLKKEAVLISYIWAVTNPATVEACAQAGISAFAVDAIPRISRAQKMDALSSQAN
ncbi:MAG TPA: NAD(P)(+) transhydrogenase (Re/Si-specific) subunit alpha, partial [Bacteroidia bacterium]|nr:NAD(P)(+) transhydrogenase (Re/Si-specific) subunit alpha [Bacteroidia bacterium]